MAVRIGREIERKSISCLPYKSSIPRCAARPAYAVPTSIQHWPNSPQTSSGSRSLGVQVERYGLAQQPAAFRDNAAVREALAQEGVECLPLFRVDDVTVSKGVYPTRTQLAEWVGLTRSTGGPDDLLPVLLRAVGAKC